MRIGVVSDVHANIVALETVLAAMGEVDVLWVLGDSVGYGPRPNECVELLRAGPHLAVAGNHEWAAIGKMSTREFNPWAARAAEWTRTELTPEIVAYLDALPTRALDGGATLVHGSPRDPIWEYVLDTDTAGENFEHFETRFCFFGHSHIPSFFRLGPDGVWGARADADEMVELGDERHRWMLNPGSVGQPRDDDPRASYMLLDLERWTATWRRVAYDIAATQDQMRKARLPERLIERLEHGW